MDGVPPRTIRLQQCEASTTIRARYGLCSAFDYLVLEKLTNFAEAATRHPDFARELPAFVAAIRQLFTIGELRSEFARLESEFLIPDAEDALLDRDTDDDDVFAEPPAAVLERAARFEMIKEMLLTENLGVS
jgi:hypothetical protein